MPAITVYRGGMAQQPTLFTTGEVMKRSGLSRQVQYQYTAMGLIEEAETTQAGHRLYPTTVLEHLRVIRLLRETQGYTLREIRDIFFSRPRPGPLSQPAPGTGRARPRAH